MFRHNIQTIVMPRSVYVVTDLEIVKDKVDKCHLVAVDNFGIQEFALSSAGWPQNSISMLARAQTLEQYNMIAQHLSKQNVDNPDLSKLPIAQQFALARPRSVQLPHEMDVYAETVAKIDISRLQKQYESTMSKTVPTKPSSSSTTES